MFVGLSLSMISWTSLPGISTNSGIQKGLKMALIELFDGQSFKHLPNEFIMAESRQIPEENSSNFKIFPAC